MVKAGRVGAQNARLHLRFVIRRRCARWQQRHPPPWRGCNRAQQPAQLLVKTQAPQQDHFVQLGLLGQQHKLHQDVARGAVQVVAIRGVRQVDTSQAVKKRQRAQPLAAHLTGDCRVVAAHQFPGFLLRAFGGLLHRQQLRCQQFVVRAIDAAQAQVFFVAQVMHVVHRQSRRAKKEVGLDLHPAHPRRPVVIAVIPSAHIIFSVAKNDVQQRADFLPQHAQVGFDVAIKGDRQQQPVGLHNRHPH